MQAVILIDRCTVRVLSAKGGDGYVSHMTVTCCYINLPLISYMC